MTKRIKIFSVILFISVLVCGVSYAQEERIQEEIIQEEANNEVYGFVLSVTADLITIEVVDYNEETGEENTEEMAFGILPELEIENAENLTEIEVGQDIDIVYREEDGKKIAEYIYVYMEVS
ncbi:MAG: hypothetical protein ABH862_05450 [Candidatus Omnitrophota bacterium]